MSDDEAGAAPETARLPAAPLAVAFCALIALTAAELIVAGMTAGRAARITALSGLLIAKVALVLSFFMQARKDRRASAPVLVAIAFAAAAAVVLMLETVWRVLAR
ncbi:MAG TPA: cytochrome C oxidase subunit IV family protein [Polyangia bacterium]|jgi:heme/copper-type cytochrome/quinol oxidase subunit 4